MIKKELTNEQKTGWIARMYFGVSNTPNHNVNPFKEHQEFLNAKVNDLSWGNDKASSKKGFSWRFIQILNIYDIQLSEDIVLNTLENDNLHNSEVVKKWAEMAIFLQFG